jgi:hypothetical protein
MGLFHRNAVGQLPLFNIVEPTQRAVASAPNANLLILLCDEQLVTRLPAALLTLAELTGITKKCWVRSSSPFFSPLGPIWRQALPPKSRAASKGELTIKPSREIALRTKSLKAILDRLFPFQCRSRSKQYKLSV